MKKTLKFLFFTILIFLSVIVYSKNIVGKLPITGNISIRYKNSISFTNLTSKFITYSDEAILKSQPRYKSKLATDTTIIIGSYTVTLLPGALIKFDNNGIIPLLGRIEVENNENSSSNLIFKTRKFSCEFISGKIIIEICPNGDSYLVAPQKVKAWLKNAYRKIETLEAGTEIFFPAFGQMKTSNIISNRWLQSPAGYANIDQDKTSTSSHKNTLSDKKVAGMTEIVSAISNTASETKNVAMSTSTTDIDIATTVIASDSNLEINSPEWTYTGKTKHQDKTEDNIKTE